MFFITSKESGAQSNAIHQNANKKRKSLIEPDMDEDDLTHYYPRRIQKACDRCRIKKTKCTGGPLCQKCRIEGAICVTTTDPRKAGMPISHSYVTMVEGQRDALVRALSQVMQMGDRNAALKLRKELVEAGISLASLPPIPSETIKIEPTDVQTPILLSTHADMQNVFATEPMSIFTSDFDVGNDLVSPTDWDSYFAQLDNQQLMNMEHIYTSTVSVLGTNPLAEQMNPLRTPTVSPAPGNFASEQRPLPAHAWQQQVSVINSRNNYWPM